MLTLTLAQRILREPLTLGCLDLRLDLQLAPWILDIDTTVKPLYGKQEGAVVSYNRTGQPRGHHQPTLVNVIRWAKN